MRNAIVEILGSLIRDLLVTAEDPEQAKTTIIGYLDTLIDRALDTSSYVRGRVFQVFCKILEAPNKDFNINDGFPTKRLKIAKMAGEALATSSKGPESR